MNTIEFIRNGLESSRGWALGLLQDVQDAPLTFPTAAGGNHPLWVLGHLVYSEGWLFDDCIMGRDSRFADWGELFGPKSTAVADAAKYPAMSDLFGSWEKIRNDAVSHLGQLTTDDLDRSSNAPAEYGPMFGTVGACYGAMIGHVHFHTGQVADARRALGRQPVFM